MPREPVIGASRRERRRRLPHRLAQRHPLTPAPATSTTPPASPSPTLVLVKIGTNSTGHPRQLRRRHPPHRRRRRLVPQPHTRTPRLRGLTGHPAAAPRHPHLEPPALGRRLPPATLTVAGSGGVPASGVGAMALNVTVTHPNAYLLPHRLAQRHHQPLRQQPQLHRRPDHPLHSSSSRSAPTAQITTQPRGGTAPPGRTWCTAPAPRPRSPWAPRARPRTVW